MTFAKDFETAARGTICEKDIEIDLLKRQVSLMKRILGYSDEDLDRALRIYEESKSLGSP